MWRVVCCDQGFIVRNCFRGFGYLAALLASAVVLGQANQVLVQGQSGIVVTIGDVEEDLLLAPTTAREDIMRNPTKVEQLAMTIYARKFLAAEAEKYDLGAMPKVRAALNKSRLSALADAAMERRDGEKPPQSVVDKLALTRYKTQPEKYLEPEKRRVRHLLIDRAKPEARVIIESVKSKLDAGASFEALAKEYSDDPGSKPKGGELPLLSPGKTVAAFERAAYALRSPGDISDIVETEFGYHLIQLVETQPRKAQPFEDVRELISAEVVATIARERRSATGNEIMSGAKVNGAAIEAFVQGTPKH